MQYNKDSGVKTRWDCSVAAGRDAGLSSKSGSGRRAEMRPYPQSQHQQPPAMGDEKGSSRSSTLPVLAADPLASTHPG